MTNGVYKKGNIVKATVSGITNYGIFVKIDEKYDGLIHISEISDKFVSNPEKYAKISDVINAEILEVDYKTSQLKLSIKNIEYKGKMPKRKKKIVETKHGFNTLAYNLPIWIEKNLKH